MTKRVYISPFMMKYRMPVDRELLIRFLITEGRWKEKSGYELVIASYMVEE